MKKLIVLFLLFPSAIFAQGKLVLVGGGSEEIGGWSDLPYQWIVQHAGNGKIAVISYSDETDFIPDYLISLGAAAADNIKISSKVQADLQSMYDSLMKYDAFFFKGGDQSYYYTYFKGTKTLDAIIDKYNAGGVISGTSAGMAILSGVIFTAEHDSVYPDEMLGDFRNPSATLANDFLPFLPGYLFDTHFTERGRGARLIGFMANWYLKTGEALTGLGVDDRTAFCIDAAKTGVVYGTGTVSIYNSVAFSSYMTNKPVADSIHVTQLLHGNSFDVHAGTILSGPANPLVPPGIGETGNYQVILSGSDALSENGDFLVSFLTGSGAGNDTIIVVTAAGKAKGYIDQLDSKNATYYVVETTEASNDASKIELRNAIRHSRKVLFAENDDTSLFNFLQQGPTGMLLTSHVKRNNILSGFVGEDSRYAGKTFVTNHLGYIYNAYYGTLNFKKGLGLLANSTIMANTYDAATSDYYENTTAAVPFTMIKDSVQYGIYLERDSYLKFYHQAGSNYFSALGQLSTIVLTNRGTHAQFESQPVDDSGATRNYVGFSEMKFTVLNGSAILRVGAPQVAVDLPYQFEHIMGTDVPRSAGKIAVYPNPSGDGIFYISGDLQQKEIFTFVVSDALGRVILTRSNATLEDLSPFDLSGYPNGVYFLRLVGRPEDVNIILIKS